MKKSKKLVFAALCVALGVILPLVFHLIPDGGKVFLPMHIPVLLCGLLCGPWYGLACGILAPLLSSLTTGMPVPALLPGMICELAVYGLVAGLLIRLVKTKSPVANIYIALIGAMLSGRVVYGILNALIFKAGEYSLVLWLTGSFVTGIIGIAVQLLLVPLLVLALRKAGLAE